MKQVIVFPKGTLNPKDKDKLSQEGYVAIEAEDPSKIVMLIPGSPKISGDEMLLCAIRGIEGAQYNDAKIIMFNHLSNVLKQNITGGEK